MPHAIPLPAAILPTLERLIASRGDGPLFNMGLTAPMHAIDRWTARWGFERFQTRDLRRTWKSRTADAGIDRFTRDLIQQHAKNDTGSKNYDRADYMPQMRAAMDKWDAWLRANVL